MAIDIEFLDISGAQIPVNKFYEFEGVTYIFKFKKNEVGNFFTVEIFDEVDENFLYGNKIVYGQTINDTILSPITGEIIPLNISILQGDPGTQEINDETFGDPIRLYTNLTDTNATEEET